MRNFLKNVFVVVTGLFVFVFISIIGLVILVAATSDGEEKIKTNMVLRLKLDKEIKERENDHLFGGSLFMPSDQTIGLLDLKKAIRVAKSDDRIVGIYLESASVQAGFATLEEIRNDLIDFKKSGKFIVAYAESYSEGSYYLASVADKIVLPPSGSVELNGLSSELIFFKGTLEKLDIQVEVFKVGNFKSAVEPFLRDKMSDDNRQQIKSFMNSIYGNYLAQVAVSRKIDPARLKVISDSMLIRNAQDALSNGIVTDLDYYNKIEEFIRSKTKQRKDSKINYVSYSALLREEREKDDKSSDQKIAVIIASGEIVSGKGSDDIIGSETTAALIRKAREDEKVKAVVLRINSPGGSALASDIIWNEVVLTRAVKPVIASMSDVAASGGYYIAMACDTIVAQPTTITGSIGVFGLMLNTEAFLKNKLGITTDREKTGQFSDVGSMSRPLTDYEKKVIQQEVDKIYEDFTAKAAKGRGMTHEDLKKYAQGRIWSGKEAVEIKLVDTLGGINDAIAIAARKAGVSNDYTLTYFPEPKNTFWKELLDGFGEGDRDAMLRNELGFLYPYLRSVKDLDKLNGVQARMPYQVIIR